MDGSHNSKYTAPYLPRRTRMAYTPRGGRGGGGADHGGFRGGGRGAPRGGGRGGSRGELPCFEYCA